VTLADGCSSSPWESEVATGHVIFLFLGRALVFGAQAQVLLGNV
jgi:hypothetical protein